MSVGQGTESVEKTSSAGDRVCRLVLAGKAVPGVKDQSSEGQTWTRGDRRGPRRNEEASGGNLWICPNNLQPGKGLECQPEWSVLDGRAEE